MPSSNEGLRILLEIKGDIGELKAEHTSTAVKVSHMEAMSESLSATVSKLAESFVYVREEALDYRRIRKEFWAPGGKASQWDDGIQRNQEAIVSLREHIDRKFAETNGHIDEKFGALETRIADLEGKQAIAKAVTKAKAASLAKGTAAVGGIAAAVKWLADNWESLLGALRGWFK